MKLIRRSSDGERQKCTAITSSDKCAIKGKCKVLWENRGRNQGSAYWEGGMDACGLRKQYGQRQGTRQEPAVL